MRFAFIGMEPIISKRECGMPTSWTRTTCRYCRTGCEMELGVRDGEVIVARPVLDSPVNKGHLRK